MGDVMNERRATARVTPAEPIPVKLKSALPARVLDISSGGIQVEVATSLRPEADCELRVQLADGEMVLRARVRRCRAWGFGLDESDRRVLLYRAGLQFADLTAEALGRLRPLIDMSASDGGTTSVSEPSPAAGGGAAAEVTTTEGALVQDPLAPLPQAPLPQAPRRTGPVKIRINSEYVRRLLKGNEKQ
jgi:hypothetical protein